MTQPESISPVEPARLARAVLYLRVSTPSQVRTDYDPEGISIPAQRKSCERRAAQMGNVLVVDEYVEPGRSGTSMDKRPAFQAMLERIKARRDVDYVIVYKLSRLNRNRVDDAFVLMQLRKYKATLVSATESIDETPVGQLMHGILAAFNEFRSAEDGADIKEKMGEKAKRGGTLGRAPIGYMNVRTRYEGRELRTVDVDPERAPFVREAFELYATGDYTLERLVDELTKRGLRTRPGRYPAGPVSDAKLSSLLRDRYYLGYVSYKGEEFPGRHQPLVPLELFEQVQLILEGKRIAGERDRVHRHYLKGSLWCWRCHVAGVDHRMMLAAARGNGGQYFYFVCAGRQQHGCQTSYMPTDIVEEKVIEHLGGMQFSAEFVELVRRELQATLADQQHSSHLLRTQLKTELARLDVQEANLVDLLADGSLPSNRAKQKLHDLLARRATLTAELDTLDGDLTAGADLLESALQVLVDPRQLYRLLSNEHRRQFLQAVFTRLYVDDQGIVEDEFREPFDELVPSYRAWSGVTSPSAQTRAGGKKQHGSRQDACSRDQGPLTDLLEAVAFGNGSGKAAMVELWGIEPQTPSMPWKCSAN